MSTVAVELSNSTFFIYKREDISTTFVYCLWTVRLSELYYLNWITVFCFLDKNNSQYNVLDPAWGLQRNIQANRIYTRLQGKQSKGRLLTTVLLCWRKVTDISHIQYMHSLPQHTPPHTLNTHSKPSETLTCDAILTAAPTLSRPQQDRRTVCIVSFQSWRPSMHPPCLWKINTGQLTFDWEQRHRSSAALPSHLRLLDNGIL